MSLLGWPHRSVLQESSPQSQAFSGLRIFLILRFLDPLPSLLFGLSLLVLLLLLGSHLALYPQLHVLIDVRKLPLQILGPPDVPPVLAGCMVQALPVIALEPDVHQLAPLHADMVLVAPLVHRVLVFVGGGQ